MGDKYINEFWDNYVSQLIYDSRSIERLQATFEKLKGKKVISPSLPFNLELEGKIIDSNDVEKYKEKGIIVDARLKLITILLELEYNTTEYVKCEYNEVIDRFIRSDYVKNLFVNFLGLIDRNNMFDFRKMSEEKFLSVINSVGDPRKFRAFKLYMQKVGQEEVKELIKK